MPDHGDIRLESTLNFKFTTRRFTTGVPFTLAGSPSLAIYVNDGTTELTAGITLTADFDGKTGVNHVKVVATAANGYAAASDCDVVIAAGTVDGVSVVGEVVGSFSIDNRSALRPTVAARTLDVSAGGEAGIDWANIGSPTAAVNLSGTNIDVDQVVASVSGAVGSVTGAVGSVTGAVGSVTGAVGSVTGNVGGNVVGTVASVVGAVGSVTGAVGSVTGAVGSVTGDVGGNVVGSVASVTADVGITQGGADKVWGSATRTLTSFGTVVADTAAAVWASGTRTITDLSAGLLGLFFTRDTTETFGDAVAGSVVKEIVDNAGGGSAPTVGQIADAVWDEAMADHVAAGSTGEALGAAGAAGDPWITALPGAYGAGSAGKIIGNLANETAEQVWATGGRSQ